MSSLEGCKIELFLPSAGKLASVVRSLETRAAREMVTPRNSERWSPVRALINLACREQSANGGIIGGVSGFKFGEILEIDILYVAPHLRGSGIGSALVDAASHRGHALGCKIISLWSADFHSHDFYRRSGFTQYGEVQNQPIGHSLYYFSRPIDGYRQVNNSGYAFYEEGPKLYDELLPCIQGHERDCLKGEAEQWKELSLAVILKNPDGRLLAAAVGSTLWDGLYCESLFVSRRAQPEDVTAFAGKMAESCRQSGLKHIRLNAFPWQHPDSFSTAGHHESCLLVTSGNRMNRKTFTLSL